MANQSTIITCSHCGQHLEVDSDFLLQYTGKEAECPTCKKNFLVANPNDTTKATRRENPFAEPIKKIIGKLRSIRWGFPFLPQLIQFCVQLLLFIMLCALYCTIGIVFHCYAIFCDLLSGTREDIKKSDLIGKSAYALAAGFYLILATPCWLIIAPFMLLGWLWKHLSWFGLILFMALLALIWFYRNDIICCFNSIAR